MEAARFGPSSGKIKSCVRFNLLEGHKNDQRSRKGNKRDEIANDVEIKYFCSELWCRAIHLVSIEST